MKTMQGMVEVLDFPVKTKCSRLISCLIYGILPCLCRPISGLWALLEHNALKLANHSMRKISYKQKPYNNNL